MTNTKAKDPEAEARERLEAAKTELDQIAAKREAEEQAAQERRAERLSAWDERFVEEYGTGEALVHEEEGAWAAFNDSIAGSDAWAPLARAWAAREIRIARSTRARAAAEGLGRSQLPHEVQYRERNLVSAIEQALGRAVGRLVTEDQEGLDIERRKAAEEEE